MLSNINHKSRRNRKGFTLIELLVVVLILAILMAVALPLYLSAIGDSQLKTCRANMQTIANTVQAARVKNSLADYSSFVGAVTVVLEPDLQSVPICPNGGAYTVLAVAATCKDAKGVVTPVPANSFGVACSFGTHGGFIPGIMSN
jgi:type IV pilus assembly protein PilA